MTAALAGNAALAILKTIAALVTGSAGMLAESFHSMADTGNQVLLLVGLRLSRRPPDALHPFGHGRDVYFWAFVVAMLLFSVGGAFSVWESIGKLRHPASHQRFTVAYIVLAFAFVFEAGSLTVAWRSWRRVTRQRSLWSFLRDARDPTLPTVVLEDTAALTSIAIAASGLLLSQITGEPAWDAVASGIIGLILIAVAVFLAFENYSLLIGEAVAPELHARLRGVIEEDGDVAALADLRTMHLGPETIAVIVEAEFREGADIPDAVARLEGELAQVLEGRTSPRLIAIEPRPKVERRSGAAV